MDIDILIVSKVYMEETIYYVTRYLMIMSTFVYLHRIFKKLRARRLLLNTVYPLFQVVEKNCTHKRELKYFWNTRAIKRIKSDSFSILRYRANCDTTLVGIFVSIFSMCVSF